MILNSSKGETEIFSTMLGHDIFLSRRVEIACFAFPYRPCHSSFLHLFRATFPNESFAISREVVMSLVRGDGVLVNLPNIREDGVSSGLIIPMDFLLTNEENATQYKLSDTFRVLNLENSEARSGMKK
jgi:hypothetical protein